jgi:hypothetical protein
MTIDSPNTILYALIGLIVIIVIILAIVVGLVVSRSRKGTASQPRKNAVAARPRLQEILRLWRDPDTGRVITEFQNRAIRDPHSLSQSERDYLVRLARDWSTWLGIPEAQPAPKTADSPAAEPAVPAVEPEPVAPAPQPNMTALPVSPAAPAVPPVTVAPTPRSIVQQVDDILQEKLAAHPVPAPTIRLIEGPDKGVIVMVNGNKYVGIGSVTDPEALAIIRSAAAEWEQRAEK